MSRRHTPGHENFEITPEQAGWISGQVRYALKKALRGHEKMQVKFGENYDPGPIMERITFLEELYETLGGDPENIENYESPEEIGVMEGVWRVQHG